MARSGQGHSRIKQATAMANGTDTGKAAQTRNAENNAHIAYIYIHLLYV